MKRKLIWLHAKCRFFALLWLFWEFKVNRQSFDEWQSRWSIIFQTGPVSRQTVSSVSEVGDLTLSELIIGQNIQDTGLWLVRTLKTLASDLLDRTEIITRLSCHYKARKLTNSMRIPPRFGETGAKKDVTMRESRDKCSIFVQVLISL